MVLEHGDRIFRQIPTCDQPDHVSESRIAPHPRMKRIGRQTRLSQNAFNEYHFYST
jgi:hypothetical protein